MRSNQLNVPEILTDKNRERYLIWYEMYRNNIGEFKTTELLEALSFSYHEGLQSGLDTPSKFFLYATARLLMPDMQALRYVMTMDIVWSSDEETDKIMKMKQLSLKSEEQVFAEYK